MIKAVLGDRLDGWLRAALPFLFRWRLDPNRLSVIGAGISVCSGLAFALGLFPAGGVLMLVGGFFDLIDGVVAREQGRASRFGAFLDSTLDRVVDMATLLGVVTWFAAQGDPHTALLAATALAIGFLVSYTQAKAELVLPDFRVGLFERGERVGLLAAGAILGFLVTALWIVTIGSAITVIQRFARAHREMGRMDAAERMGVERGR